MVAALTHTPMKFCRWFVLRPQTRSALLPVFASSLLCRHRHRHLRTIPLLHLMSVGYPKTFQT